MVTLLLGHEVDRLLRYPTGKSERLAKRGKLPHVKLPDGAIRFRQHEIEQLVATGTAPEHVQEVAVHA